jgi:hypothetical protein
MASSPHSHKKLVRQVGVWAIAFVNTVQGPSEGLSSARFQFDTAVTCQIDSLLTIEAIPNCAVVLSTTHITISPFWPSTIDNGFGLPYSDCRVHFVSRCTNSVAGLCLGLP